MTQTLNLTLTGNVPEEEVYGVQSDKDLSELQHILRGYEYQNIDTDSKEDGT